MKTFAVALCFAGASAQGVRGLFGPTKDYGAYQHDRVWGHGHYEPGDIERFDNHFAEIYGSDDLAWGPNGYHNPHAHSDNHHNWDDQGDAYVCHGCGGHGCTLCGGYGHGHRNAAFGEHGHGLKTGLGVGHSHAYLGDKPRSSYNRYGHGVGGRYTQRWSNGYGNRYGLGHGHRYGLAHRWSQYNGYGHGNPSSKGSVLGFGLGANAQIPQLYHVPETYGDKYDPYLAYGDSFEYGDYTPDYKKMDYESEYEEPEYYEDEYEEPMCYGEECYEPNYYEDEYEEPEYYEDEYEEPMYYEPHYYQEEYNEPLYYEDEYEDPYYDDGYSSYGYEPSHEELFTDGYGLEGEPDFNPVGREKTYSFSFGHGSGNHSPWN